FAVAKQAHDTVFRQAAPGVGVAAAACPRLVTSAAVESLAARLTAAWLNCVRVIDEAALHSTIIIQRVARAMTTTGPRPAPGRPQTFNHRSIEPKWQQRWEADKLYEANVDASRPKHYAMVMFPYTSGDLHLGHWWNFALADVHARYKRMTGFNVLFPPGFDAFGLPAEGAAIKSGTHPYTWTMENIRRMERQWRTMGGSYDWSKEVATCQPE